MKKFYKHILIFCAIIFTAIPGESAITSIVLSPASPTTMSNSRGYYLAGSTYTFTLNVIDPLAANWGADVSDVRLTIQNGATPIVIYADPTGTGAHVPTITGGPVNASINITGNPYNFTATFTVTFRWDTAGLAWDVAGATRNAAGRATCLSTATDTKNLAYGISSSVRIHNFSQDGVAADGYVNTNHTNFNVTGTLIYDIPGGGAADAVTGDAAHVTGTELYINNTATGITNGATNALSYNVTPATVIPTPPTVTAWYVRVTGPNVPAGGDISTNSLSIVNDEVEVTDIEIIGGGGRQITGAPTRVEYRSFNVPGTQIRVHARMRYGLTGVIGNTTVRVWDAQDNINYDVSISNGQTEGALAITGDHPNTPAAAGATNSHQYQAISVSSGITDDEQNLAARIYQPGNPLYAGSSYTVIWWDRGDPPGNNTGDFNGALPTPFATTAGSVRINWTALTNASPDLDFDTYKVYYRMQGLTLWTVVDRNTANFASLGITGTNTVLLNGLQPLTNYEIRLTAVDIFGNETQSSNIYTITTGASDITLKITDSITSYDILPSTLDPDPLSNYRLRLSNIKIESNIITSGNIPQRVEILLADNSTDIAGAAPAGQWGVTGSNDDLRTGTFYTIPTIKTGPNTWTGYIQSGDPLMNTGSTLRFILRIYYDSFFVDADRYYSIATAPTNPTHYEWRFYIYSEPVFTPWPVRILNNVITDDNPVAYPAYYLTDDAFVTITAYDIKGRVVAVLLEDAFRKAGQNIKEQGWRGTNKYNKKLGVGLYYIHVKAKRTSDGKIILDTFKKVVMAR